MFFTGSVGPAAAAGSVPSESANVAMVMHSFVVMLMVSFFRDLKKRNNRLRGTMPRVRFGAQAVSVFQMSTCRRQAPSSCFHSTTYFGVARWPPASVSVARPIS